MLVEENKESTDEKAKGHRRIELKNTPQRGMLEVKHEHVANVLVTQSRNEQGYLTTCADYHTESQPQMTHVALTDHSTNDSSQDDTNMIRGGGNSRPAKFFTGKERRL